MKINTAGNVPKSAIEYFSKHFADGSDAATVEELSICISADRTHLSVVGQFKDDKGLYKKTMDYHCCPAILAEA